MFPRAIYYLVIPMCLISAEGLDVLLDWSKRNVSRVGRSITSRDSQVIFVALILVPGIAMQAWVATYPSPYRSFSELDEDTFHVYALAQWVKANISEQAVIAYPNSGGQGRLFDLIVKNKVLFAERRYSDIPDYIMMARLYDSEGLSWMERTAIIEQYSISLIITGFSYQIENITRVKDYYYPTMIHFRLYDYDLIVLYEEYYLGPPNV